MIVNDLRVGHVLWNLSVCRGDSACTKMWDTVQY